MSTSALVRGTPHQQHSCVPTNDATSSHRLHSIEREREQNSEEARSAGSFSIWVQTLPRVFQMEQYIQACTILRLHVKPSVPSVNTFLWTTNTPINSFFCFRCWFCLSWLKNCRFNILFHFTEGRDLKEDCKFVKFNIVELHKLIEKWITSSL